MVQRPVICKGDKTSHGGVVITGDETVMVFGQPMARLGDSVTCPKCPGTHKIIEGVQDASSDKQVALEGMRTSCGATLVAGQMFYRLEAGSGGGSTGAGQDAPADAPAAAAPAQLKQGADTAAASAPAAAAATAGATVVPANEAPTKCAHVRDTRKLPAALFEAKRAPVKMTGPTLNPVPIMLKQKDENGRQFEEMLYEAFPRGHQVDIYAPRPNPYELPSLGSNPAKALNWQPPSVENVQKSLGILPEGLLNPKGAATNRFEKMAIRIIHAMETSDQKAHKDSWDGIPYLPRPDPTDTGRAVGDMSVNAMRLYPSGSMRGLQAEVDHSVIHEYAHSYASMRRLDIETDWTHAIKSDGNSPSQYASTSPQEDFAEFAVLAVVIKGTPCESYARSVYPARYKIVDKLGYLN